MLGKHRTDELYTHPVGLLVYWCVPVTCKGPMLFLHVSLSPLESPECEVLTDVAVSSDTTQTAASCGNVRHRGFQASPLL